MNLEEKTEHIQLVYQGPKDSSPDTLRRIKTTFVASLNFSIEETRRIVEGAPCLITSTTDEEKINHIFQLLNAAGAQVVIVTPDTGPEDSSVPLSDKDGEGENAFWTPVETVEDNTLPHGEKSGDTEAFEIELDLTSALTQTKAATSPEPRVYELHEDNQGQDALPHSLEMDDSLSPQEPAVSASKTVLPATKTPETDDAPLFSFEDISKALEESQKNDVGEQALRNSAVSAPEGEEFDLSFDDAPVISPKKSSPADKPSSPGPSAKEDPGQEDPSFSGMVMEESEPALPSPDSSPNTASEVGDIPHSENPVQPVSVNPYRGERLSDLAARASEHARNRPVVPEVQDDGIERISFESRGRPLWIDIGIPVLVLGLLMGGGTWYYFNSGNKVKLPSIDLSQLVSQEPSPSVAPATPAPEASVSKILHGRTQQGTSIFTAEFMVDKGLITTWKIEISTLPPPPLTSEQIVHRIRQKPWLKRVVIEETPLTFHDNRNFSTNAPVKAYIDNDKNVIRLIATAVVSGTFDEASGTITAHIKASYNPAGAAFTDNDTIQRLDDGSIAFSVEGDVTATRQP